MKEKITLLKEKLAAAKKFKDKFSVQTQQWLFLGILIGSVVLVIGLINSSSSNKSTTDLKTILHSPDQEKAPVTVVYKESSDIIDKQAYKDMQQDQKHQNLRDSFNNFAEQQSSNLSENPKIKELEHENNDLKAVLQMLQGKQDNTEQIVDALVKKSQINEEKQRVIQADAAKIVEIKLTPKTSVRKTIDETIPALTHVKATLLTGLDVSTASSTQEHPEPITMIITDKAVLPNKYKYDIDYCRIRANAYGELSTERVKAWLEKISCVTKKQEMIIIPVKGEVYGEDGKVGIGGTLVRKAMPYATASAGAAVLEAAGAIVTPQSNLVQLGSSTVLQSPSLSDRALTGAGQGISAGTKRLSDYLIKEADQLAPVIQVKANREVDIIFSEEVDFTQMQVVDQPNDNDVRN